MKQPKCRTCGELHWGLCPGVLNAVSKAHSDLSAEYRKADEKMKAAFIGEVREDPVLAKSLRGGGESRTAAQHGVDTAGVRIPKAKADVSGRRSIAGVASGPRKAKLSCPVCEARRWANLAAQKRFRAKAKQ